MGYKNLFAFAAELGAELGSLYCGNSKDRANFMAFMDANDWFGVTFTIKDHIVWILEEDLPKIQESLTLWLSAYRRPGRDKIALMLKYFEKIYPETCRLYNKFVTSKNLSDDPSAWKLLDFLLSESGKDIVYYDESDIERMIKSMEVTATRTVARMFSAFLNTVKRDGKPLSQWKYSFSARDNTMIINDAYSINDFSVMAYCVFNEAMWARQGLLEKALKYKTYADLWMFVALHFVCALRSGDMERLPAPTLPYSGVVVLEKIAGGTFAPKEAAALVDELHIRLKAAPQKPSKTSAFEDVPDIKLFVPESLRVPFGIIMAISLAHHPEIRPGSGFVKPNDRVSNVRDFFGEYFLDAIGKRHFSSRRCNKSYLQGIELAAEDEEGKPKGYMLAALARSHKSGIEKLAETTAIYLKDAKFGGYSPEFIIAQMFERGVFSFVPAALLEIYIGEKYTKLSVSGQTKLIGEIGLAAVQIEGLAEMTERAMIKSRNAVADVVRDCARRKENAGIMLQNIASGAAPGRQNGCLCLMSAARLKCPYSWRGGCIGCGYEIYTKTAMYALMREFVRLKSGSKDAAPADAYRYEKIIENGIKPSVAEMLAAAKLYYPNADVSELYDIMEVEMNGIHSGTGRNGRQLQPLNADS